ncbi:MAG: GSCFA domain-containing protein [Chitinophagaceae bacterium]|nr:GSCFA domain-containing protein [Chitinophagaceae bacterium]
MDMMLNIDLKKLVPPISYRDKIMLVGSCFTEHIGNALGDLKFSILQNPNGILFGPDAVCKSLLSYAENKKYTEADMFQLNEVWNSWQHHSRFSNLSSGEAIRIINESQQQAHDFLQEADWLIITLGSSFTYRLTQQAATAKHAIGDTVANCHRAPANWCTKEMMELEDIKSMLEDCLKRLKEFNPKLKFIFTVSPVRHIRDGVVENNRSKARLIESVHYIDAKFESAYYFPAYELVIDVLRDYRFYDIDLVHPNYPATEFVLEKFAESCIDENTQQLMQEVKKIIIARKHKPFQPETKAHLQFLITHFEKAKLLQEKYSFLDLKEELVYFSQI